MRWACRVIPEQDLPQDVTFVARAALLSDIGARLDRRDGFAVATLNLDHVVKLRADALFRRAYRHHTHVTADGHPIVWLERLAGRSAHRTTGADLVVPLVQLAANKGLPIALVGATDESLAGAADALATAAPGVRICARIAPTLGFDPSGPEADAIVEDLRQSGARLCLIALGAPKQEMFAARAFDSLPEMGFVSIGAGLDFLSGQQTRAPKFVQSLALEWLWRLGSDPRRLGSRYLACLSILPALAFEATRLRLAETAEAPRYHDSARPAPADATPRPAQDIGGKGGAR